MHIPPQNMEIEQIYARTLDAGARAISISSANTGEGVTSIAMALAQRNLLAGRSTLVVDLNLHHPALNSLLSLEKNPSETTFLDEPQLVTTEQHAIAITGITVPKIGRASCRERV